MLTLQKDMLHVVNERLHATRESTDVVRGSLCVGTLDLPHTFSQEAWCDYATGLDADIARLRKAANMLEELQSYIRKTADVIQNGYPQTPKK